MLLRRSVRGFAKDERGQVIVLVAVMFLALVFAVALVVNTGILFVQRRAAQEAADSAAIAGALQLVAVDRAAGIQAAVDAAQLNGYSSGVTVNIPPLSGPNTGNSRYVEVLISTSNPALLVPQWGITAVGARAVAGGGGAPAQAIFTLGGSGTGLSLQANGVLGLYRQGAPVGCGYYQTDQLGNPLSNPWTTPDGLVDCRGYGGNAQVNSSDSAAAATVSGSPGGLIGPPSTVSESVVGCTSPSIPNPKFPGGSCAQPRLTDPFYPYPKPVPGAVTNPPSSPNWCREDTSNLVAGSTVCGTYNSIPNCGTSLVLQPGIYTATISGSCQFILKPGIYVFTGSSAGLGNLGGGIRVLGNNASDTFECEVPAVCGTAAGQIGVPGTRPYHRDPVYGNAATPTCGQDTTPPDSPRCGVLLFFTYTGYPGTPSGSGCATLGIAGQSVMDLAPEPTGTWQGMLVYYDNNAFCGTGIINVNGNGALNGTSFRGLIYAPTAKLVMNGSNPVAVLSQLVVKEIDVGNGTVIVNVGSAQVRAAGGLRLTE